ncbi:hypothetical protein [Amphritea sp. HPY]|uniref:hypothetical protein n=1 Tax=Amphritea sp. HPY TaxID=3421652 RepID=UPI003D7DE5A2
MAMQRAKTRNIVVVMSGTPIKSSTWDLSCAYRDKGVPDIGSHYVILEDGDVISGRPHSEHGNVDPRHNKDAVFIEIMGIDPSAVTPHQQTAAQGVISRMEETYLNAEPLDYTTY